MSISSGLNLETNEQLAKQAQVFGEDQALMCWHISGHG